MYTFVCILYNIHNMYMQTQRPRLSPVWGSFRLTPVTYKMHMYMYSVAYQGPFSRRIRGLAIMATSFMGAT